MKKVLWVKFGWSDYYRGGPVDGNFGWLNKQRGKKNEGRGGEAFNFLPAQDGTYYCYVPPQGGEFVPCNADNAGWTVVCLAKNPKRKGIHVVGWYENATLIGKWVAPHPAAPDGNVSYCIKSKSAYFIPPQGRIKPFSDKSIKQGKYSFLSGPDVEVGESRRRVLKLLERKIAALQGIAIHNPNGASVPDPENDPTDPLAGYFGTPEHRKKVEKAAERAVVKEGLNKSRSTRLRNVY